MSEQNKVCFFIETTPLLLDGSIFAVWKNEFDFFGAHATGYSFPYWVTLHSWRLSHGNLVRPERRKNI